MSNQCTMLGLSQARLTFSPLVPMLLFFTAFVLPELYSSSFPCSRLIHFSPKDLGNPGLIVSSFKCPNSIFLLNYFSNDGMEGVTSY